MESQNDLFLGPTKRDPPFFSIIIPTYNRAQFILKALNSVLSQEFSSYEIIIVDDGSTDNTKDLIADLIEGDHRIQYLYKQNEERSIARNYGIMHAKGRYVGFLDSDDFVYPNHLFVAYEMFRRNEFPEVGHLGYEIVSTRGESLLLQNSFDNSYKTKLIHENIFSSNAIFIRKDVVNTLNFIPSSFATVSEDWYLWLRLAARYQFCFDNTVTSAIIHHDERSLLNIDPDKLIASTKCVIEHLKNDAFFLREYNERVSYHFANHYTLVTLILSTNKNRRIDTIKYLIKATIYDPTVIFRKRFLASIKHLLLSILP